MLRQLFSIWNRPDHGDRKSPLTAVIVSIVFHILLLFGAGYLTVMVLQSREKVMFEAKKPPSIPARKLEHSIRVKQMQQQVRKPQILQRLVSQAPSAVALPELPKMDAPDIRNMRDTPILNNSQSMLGQLGRDGGGLGRGMTGGGGYSDAKFFGQNVRTRAVCILFDCTGSMYSKGVVTDVKREASRMLEELNPATKFNLIAFVDGAEGVTPSLVFAIQENKEKAIAWLDTIQENRQGNRSGYSGSTPDQAIRMAVDIGADTIFLLTDDFPNLSKVVNGNRERIDDHADQLEDFIRGIETQYGRSVKINPILYKPNQGRSGDASRDYWKKIARITGGKMQVIED